MIRCFINSAFSKSAPVQIHGAGVAISTKRLFGDSPSLHFPLDQLPDLDDEKAAKLREKIDQNERITCLTPDKIAQINEISRKKRIAIAFSVFLQEMRGSEHLYDKKTQEELKDLEDKICAKH